MTKPEAHRILDLARAGGLVPAHYITQALVVTGDISPWKPPRAGDEPLPEVFWPAKETETA